MGRKRPDATDNARFPYHIFKSLKTLSSFTLLSLFVHIIVGWCDNSIGARVRQFLDFEYRAKDGVVDGTDKEMLTRKLVLVKRVLEVQANTKLNSRAAWWDCLIPSGAIYSLWWFARTITWHSETTEGLLPYLYAYRFWLRSISSTYSIRRKYTPKRHDISVLFSPSAPRIHALPEKQLSF